MLKQFTQLPGDLLTNPPASAPASASSTAQSTTTTSEELPVAPAPAPSTAQSTTIATPEELLVAAAQQGNDGVVQLVLSQNFNSNIMASATLAAAKNKHWKVVLRLMKHGASLTMETLILAINEDQKDVITEFLRQHKTDSLFNWAVKNNHIEIVTLLLEKDAKIDNSTDPHNNTLILAITHNASAEMCRLLIEKGASVNVVDHDGWTPLSLALINKRDDTVKLLFEKDAKIDNSTDPDNNTLICAIHAEASFDTLKLIIERDVHINIVVNGDDTPLRLVIRQQRLDIISLFLDNGAQVDEATFMKAVQNRQWDVLKLFIKRNLTFDTRSTYKHTLIILLAQSKRWDLVQLLLPSGIDAGDLNTLLSLAIENDQVEIVTALFDKKQDLHLANGHTPLELAALCGSERVVKLLISRKEDVNSTGAFGYTPLRRAINSNHLNIVKLLVGGGATVKPSDPENCKEGAVKQFLQDTLRSQNAKGSETLASSSGTATAALLVQSNPFQSQGQGQGEAVTPVPAAMEKPITSLPANSFQ